MALGGGNGIKLDFTPTWIVAGVCLVIVSISFAVERFLHYLGKVLKRKNKKPLYEALLKVKEELMLLGFISLMLVAFQGLIQRICIPERITGYLLPCDKDDDGAPFASAGGDSTYCANKGKVPLLSLEAINQLHLYIFVLAISHVVLSFFTMLFGGLKIQQWKRWEDSIHKGETRDASSYLTDVSELEFIKERYHGFDKDSRILSWAHSFVRQFYGSVTKSDYTTLRLSFIMTHCRGSPLFDFHKYMVRSLEADFKKVVGISWCHWIFVVVFLLLNVDGWNIYFWISFIPLIVLLVVGTKLEHIITELAHEVAEKHTAIEGDLVIKLSNYHFWFHRPQVILHLLHFILFQNAFEISYFFWILVGYGFNSCIMGNVGFLVPRLVISVVTQLLCSYSTLPLYALVTQMGSSFKREIFEEHVQQSLIGWIQKVKQRNSGRDSRSGSVKFENSSSTGMRMQNGAIQQASRLEEGRHEPTESI